MAAIFPGLNVLNRQHAINWTNDNLFDLHMLLSHNELWHAVLNVAKEGNNFRNVCYNVPHGANKTFLCLPYKLVISS